MHTVEILKQLSRVLVLLTGLCFCYQTVYLIVSLFWKEPKHLPEKPTRYAILIASGFGLIIAVSVQFIAEPIVALFTDGSRADGAEVIRLGGQYLRGYIWDSFLAGIQFSFSGYFCAIGRSGLSFLHNFLSIVCVRVPGAYLASRFFPQTLLPMGLAPACGSLLSVIICVIAYALLARRKSEGVQHG